MQYRIVTMRNKDYDLLHRTRKDELMTWLESLGVDPNVMRTQLVISESGGQHYLHLSRIVRGPDGVPVIDHAKGEIQSEPVVIKLGTERNWPKFLGNVDDAAAEAVTDDDEELAKRIKDLKRTGRI